MFALPAGLQLGWLLYERARALTGAASHISSWISLLLSDVDGEVRVLLEQLVQRVDALTPALTFALGWSSDKGSAVSDVVFAAKSQLFRVEQFIHQCTKQKGQVKLIDRDWLIRNLNSHLRELDFAIQSVTLCVSLITASRPQQPQSAVVSASALLRASDRLQSMHAQGGDVTCSFGALYTLSSGDAPHGSGTEERQHEWDDDSSESRSTLPLSTSTFLTDYDHFSVNPDKQKSTERQQQAQSQQTAPQSSAAATDTADGALQATALTSAVSSLSPTPSSRLPSGSSVPVCDVRAWLNESIIESDRYQPSVGHDGAALASSLPPSPAVDQCRSADSAEPSPTWRRIWPAAALKIYRNTARNVYELHVENLAADPALLDGELLSSPSLSSSSGRRLRFDLSSSLSFRCTNSRAIGVAEDEAVKSQSSALLDVCFHWCSQWVSRVQCQYAFMLLDLDVSTHGRQADSLRPLDIAYAARLCCYENQTTRPQHGNHDQSSRLFHIQATDEELWMLFANHTRAADEQTDLSKQPFPLGEQLPSHLQSAFPPAMLASPAALSSSAVSSSSSSSSSSSRRSAGHPLSSSSWSSVPDPSSTSLAPVDGSPPLDSTLRVAVADHGNEEPPSPLGPLPSSSGVHVLRSISTSSRRAITTSFSDLPHFTPFEHAASFNPTTATSHSAAMDTAFHRTSRSLPPALANSADENASTKPFNSAANGVSTASLLPL